MALTVSTGTTNGRAQQVEGARRVTRVEVTFDNAYAEGGEAFDAAQYHGSSDIQVVAVQPTSHIAARGGIVLTYDPSTAKIRAFGTGSTDLWTELCACDLSTLTAVVTITGR